MNTIDMRFDEKIIENLTGKDFKLYKCDEFVYTNSVTQIVGLLIEDKWYSLTNVQHTVDYFGDKEDIAVFDISETDACNVKSAFTDTEMIVTPVEGNLERIVLVNENQKIVTDCDIPYDVWLTRGIILHVNGREISFEKDNVPFSEEIIIRKGYDLLDQFADENDFLEGWNTKNKPQCKRQIVVFRPDKLD